MDMWISVAEFQGIGSYASTNIYQQWVTAAFDPLQYMIGGKDVHPAFTKLCGKLHEQIEVRSSILILWLLDPFEAALSCQHVNLGIHSM